MNRENEQDILYRLRGCVTCYDDKDEEDDEERSKTSTLGLSVSSDNVAGMFHVRLNVTEPRPIS